VAASRGRNRQFEVPTVTPASRVLILLLLPCCLPLKTSAVDGGCADQQLQSTLDDERGKANALGMNLGVQRGSCTAWVGASGFGDLAKTKPLQPSDRFRIYSITKTFTAALAFKLIERGSLSLDDPLSKWYPALPGPGKVKVRHLLSHTSGLFDVLTDDNVVARRHEHWDHDTLIAVAESHPLDFEPGAKAAYVNTNFLLMGRIIEKVTGEAYAVVLRRELLDPLGLRDSYLAGDEPARPFVEGSKHDLVGNFVDATNAWDDSMTWSAGGLVSTAADQLTWFRALFGGRVLQASSLQTLMTPPKLADGTDSYFGYDVTVSSSSAGPYYSHEGGGSGVGLLGDSAFGFHAHLGWLKDSDLTIVVLSNTGTADVNGARNAALRALAVMQ
jgi:D-alanyl-D-alanine carboxypeptidase